MTSVSASFAATGGATDDAASSFTSFASDDEEDEEDANTGADVEAAPSAFNCKLLTFFIIVITGRKEIFYLTTHSTHFIYGYMAAHIW